MQLQLFAEVATHYVSVLNDFFFFFASDAAFGLGNRHIYSEVTHVNVVGNQNGF